MYACVRMEVSSDLSSSGRYGMVYTVVIYVQVDPILYGVGVVREDVVPVVSVGDVKCRDGIGLGVVV